MKFGHIARLIFAEWLVIVSVVAEAALQITKEVSEEFFAFLEDNDL
jgi:hypothetical protein